MRHRSIILAVALAVTAVAPAAAAEPAKPSTATTQTTPAAMTPNLPKLHQPSANLWVSGQPSAEQFAEAQRAGVQRIINLRPASEDPSRDEAAELAALGLPYTVLPIASAADLTRANVEALDRLLAESAEQTTLLHCASGNRVGALMSLRAAWLQGADPEAALAVGRAHGLTAMEPVVRQLLTPIVESKHPL